VLEDYAERILDIIAEYPDRTLDELVVAMRKRRVPGSRSALGRFLDRHDITVKKKPAGGGATSRGCGSRAAALGTAARVFSIRPDWYSSMRLRPAPIWSVSGDAARAACA
jgi:hypothetical protein